MDASGSNRRFARYLLYDKNKVVNGNIQHAYGINVFLGALYKIFVWFCSTHNIKNVRNQLLASSGTTGAPRVFHDSKYVPFGWRVIKDQWKREVERINQQQAPETDLSESAVFPDSWNKMRVTHAKAVFSEKTLTEEMTHYSTLLKCEDHVINYKLTGKEISIGMTLSTKRACILECKAHEIENVPLNIKSGIACLMYRAHVGALFNELLMDKHVRINRSNVGLMEKKIMHALDYMTQWYSCREIRRNDNNKEKSKMWEKSVLSCTTYDILFLGSLGFIQYCKYMLDKYPNIHFIAVLFSNTSSIESHFSLMRWLGADTPKSYEANFNFADNKKSMKRLKNNPMYEAHEEKGIRNTSLYGDKSGRREQIISEHEVIRKSDIFVNMFSEEGKGVIYGSYKQHLLEHTNLRNYCKAGLHTQQESYILYFLQSIDVKEELCFNNACQQVMTSLLLCLDTAVGNSDVNVNGSFWYNVYNYLGSAPFKLIVEAFPRKMANLQLVAAIVFSLVKHFEDILKKCLTNLKQTSETGDEYYGPKTFTEVQRYVGWAISSRKIAVQKRLLKLNLKEKEDTQKSEFQMEEDLLKKMSTSEDEVQADKEYMTKYYPPVDQMYNRGGLTLVSKSYLKWAKNLIIEINRNINLDMIWKNKNDVMKEAVKSITNNKSLLQLFREALPKIPAINEGVIRR